MKTAFLIINYNDVEITMKLVKNIKNFSCLDVILIVDNHSTDSSYEILQKKKNKKIKVISSPSRNYGAGINFGCHYLIDKYGVENIFISNSDIVIEKEEDLGKLIKKGAPKNIGIVAPIILEKEHENKGWKLPSPKVELLCNIPFFHRYFKQKYLKYPESHYQKGISYVDVASGSFFLMKAKSFIDVGGFDENTLLYYEENIISTKLKRKKYKVMIVSDVKVIHAHSVTINKSVTKINKFKILRKSQYYFEETYNGASSLTLCLFKIINAVEFTMYSMYYKLLDRKVENHEYNNR